MLVSVVTSGGCQGHRAGADSRRGGHQPEELRGGDSGLLRCEDRHQQCSQVTLTCFQNYHYQNYHSFYIIYFFSRTNNDCDSVNINMYIEHLLILRLIHCLFSRLLLEEGISITSEDSTGTRQENNLLKAVSLMFHLLPLRPDGAGGSGSVQ